MSATVAVVEQLLAQVAAGNADAVPVLEDAILEGVTGAGKVRYLLVQSEPRKRMGLEYPAERERGAFAVVVPGQSIRLVGIRYLGSPAPKAYDKRFALGDLVEYDSFNLSYHGRIATIGAKGHVTVEKEHSERKVRLTLHTFHWRNWDLDLDEAARRNHEVSMSL